MGSKFREASGTDTALPGSQKTHEGLQGAMMIRYERRDISVKDKALPENLAKLGWELDPDSPPRRNLVGDPIWWSGWYLFLRRPLVDLKG